MPKEMPKSVTAKAMLKFKETNEERTTTLPRLISEYLYVPRGSCLHASQVCKLIVQCQLIVENSESTVYLFHSNWESSSVCRACVDFYVLNFVLNPEF